MSRAFLLAVVALALSGGRAQAAQPAYVATVGSPAGMTRVELLSQDGHRVRVLATFGSLNGNWEASWSPDRHRLAWISWDGLHVARADGTHDHLIAASSGTMRYAWSPDSRTLAISDDGRLFTITATGAHRMALAPWASTTTYWTFGWSDEGVLATQESGKAGTATCCSYSVIAARPRSAPRVIYHFPDWHCECSRPSLAPDGKRFAYFDNGRARLVEIRTGTSRLRSDARHRITGPFWAPTWTRVQLPPLPRGTQLLSLDRR